MSYWYHIDVKSRRNLNRMWHFVFNSSEQLNNRVNHLSNWTTESIIWATEQQSQSSEQLNNRVNHLSNWTTESIIWATEQQSQSSEQLNNRVNHLSNWTTESIIWDTTTGCTEINPFQPEFFYWNLNKNNNSIQILRYLLNGYSTAHEIFYAHGEHLGDQHKLLAIPLEEIPLLTRNSFYGNSTQFYVLCIFKTHEIKLIYNNYIYYYNCKVSVEHVTQRILNIRSVAVVAMGLYVNNH